MAEKTLPIEKVRGLLTRALDLHAQMADLLREVDALLGGGVGIGQTLKAAEYAFESAWTSRYVGQRYVWTYVRDVPQLKRLLKSMDVAELSRRAANYVLNDDPFFVRCRHSFGAFVTSINQHAAAAVAPADLDLEELPVADCKHAPRCRTDTEHTRRRSQEMRGTGL